MDNTRQAVAARQANGNLFAWLTTPRERTGIRILDNVLNNLPTSHHDLWLADYPRVLANCHWVNGERSSIATLQWRIDAPNK
jgi:hypothetical protein